MYIDKPFNLRPLCLWALLAGVTIVFCMWSFWAAGVWLVLLISGFFTFHFFTFKDKILNFLATSRIFSAVSVLLCIAVVLSFGITTLAYTQQQTHSGPAVLTGTIENHRFRPVDEGVSYFVLSSVKFNDKKLSGRTIVFVNDYDNETMFATGDIVTFRTSLRTQRAADEESERAAMNVNSRVKYSASASISAITKTDTSRAVRFTVLRYSKDFLNKYLKPQNAELMISMLFGDKSALDDEIRDNFAITGLAHVLAVSGLHVGIIIGLIMSVLRLLRLNRRAQFPVILVILLFYCYLCDFRFSILRATIMFLVFTANRIYLRNTDFLSSICMAAALTLVLFPYALLSVSFQLSYACMLGIALFQQPIVRVLNKTVHPRTPRWLEKVQRFFIAALAIQCSITVASLPIIIKYFGVFPIFGMIVNLLFLPILVLAFQATVLAVFTFIAFPLLYLINYLIDFVRMGTQALASIPWAQIHLANGGYWLVFYIAGLFMLSRFVFMPRRYKYIGGIFLLCLYSVGFLL